MRTLGLFDRVEVRQAPARRPVGESLRVGFWNVERCKYLQALADLLAAVKPDIVLLAVKRLSILTPLSGTAEVVPVVNRGDPRGFV